METLNVPNSLEEIARALYEAWWGTKVKYDKWEHVKKSERECFYNQAHLVQQWLKCEVLVRVMKIYKRNLPKLHKEETSDSY